MVEPGEKVVWRRHFNVLIARPIPKSEYPGMVRAMLDDGLVAVIEDSGLVYYHGRYALQKKAVRDAWGLSESQFERFNRWVYMNDAFIVEASKGDQE